MSGWDEIVAAALIGTDRRPLEPGVPEGAPAGLEDVLRERGVEDRLLGAAAAWTVARRAGAVAGAPVEVTPAEEDPRPIAPGVALRDRLEGVHPSLLAEWLALAAERGLRPPPELVPALLDHAAVDASLHAAVGEAAGRLGHWLADRNARWAFARGAGEDVDAVWAGGASEERRALLERLRRTDPPAGRALLAGTFADEAWEDRAAFVAALAHGLSHDDEPLLEAALDDRRKPVRDAATTLLAGLPRSRFAARMSARTAPLLRVEGGRRLVAELPAEPDAAAKRDGVAPTGRRSERLRALIAATPLATWTGAPSPSGGDAPSGEGAPAPLVPAIEADPPVADGPTALVAPPLTPASTAPASPRRLAALDVADDLEDVVHAGWVDAAVAQRDAEWARALWEVRRDPVLLVALPHDEGQARAMNAAQPDVAAAALPGPWGHALSTAVIDAIRKRRTDNTRGPDVEFAGYRLDPALAGAAEERLRELGGRDLRRLCDLLSARAAMLRELS